MGTVDMHKRSFEAPFEIRDRAALIALCSRASPRLRLRMEADSGEAGGAAGGESDAAQDTGPSAVDKLDRVWIGDMLTSLCDHLRVDEMGKGLDYAPHLMGHVTVDVEGYGLCFGYNVQKDDVWLYRYRDQRAKPAPGHEYDPLADMSDVSDSDDEKQKLLPDGTPAPDSDSDSSSSSSSSEEEDDDDDDDDGAKKEEDEIPEGEWIIRCPERVMARHTVKRGAESATTVLAAVGDAGLLSGHEDGAVRLWIAGKQSSSQAGVRLGEHERAVNSVVATGRHAFTGSQDGSVRHWDVMTRTCVGVLPGHTDGVQANCLALADDGCANPTPCLLAVGCRNGSVLLWAVEREEHTCLCVIHPAAESPCVLVSLRFDPQAPCLYACTKAGELLCFLVSVFLRMHVLLPDRPEQPLVRLLEAHEIEEDKRPPAAAPATKLGPRAGAPTAFAEGASKGFCSCLRARVLLPTHVQTSAEKLEAVVESDEVLQKSRKLDRLFETAIGIGMIAEDAVEHMRDNIEQGKFTTDHYIEMYSAMLADVDTSKPPPPDEEEEEEAGPEAGERKPPLHDEEAGRAHEESPLAVAGGEDDGDFDAEGGKTKQRCMMCSKCLKRKDSPEEEEHKREAQLKRLHKSMNIEGKSDDGRSSLGGLSPSTATTVFVKPKVYIPPGVHVRVLRSKLSAQSQQYRASKGGKERLMVPGCMYAYWIEGESPPPPPRARPTCFLPSRECVGAAYAREPPLLPRARPSLTRLSPARRPSP